MINGSPPRGYETTDVVFQKKAEEEMQKQQFEMEKKQQEMQVHMIHAG